MGGETILLLTLMTLVPAACAVLLRRARCPGWPIIGGILAGALLGPTIMGRVPQLADLHEAMFVGGAPERKALDEMVRRQGADVIAAENAGVGADEMRSLAAEHRRERAPLDAALREAEWRDQRPVRALTMAVAALVLLSAGLLRRPAPRDPPPADAGVVATLSIGSWAAAFPGAIAYLCCRRWFGFDEAASALASAAVMIGPWALRTVDRRAADGAEVGGARTIEAAGRFASLAAITLAMWGMWHARGGDGLLLIAPLLALAIGRLLPPVNARAVQVIMLWIILPMLAAAATVKVELLLHFSFWPIVIFALLSGDGRWLGALLGALLPGGRSLLRSMRLVLGSMACGPTQLAVAALALHAWVIPPQLAYALILGAALIEITAPVRRRAAAELTEAEEEMEELRRDG